MFPMNVAREAAVRTAGEKYVLPPSTNRQHGLVSPALQAETKLRKSPPEGSVGMERSKFGCGKGKGVVEDIELGKVDRTRWEAGRDHSLASACHDLVGGCAGLVTGA